LRWQAAERIRQAIVTAIAAQPDAKFIERLESDLKRQAAIIAAENRLAWVKANMNFYIELVASAGNQLMNDALVPLASHTVRYRINLRRQRMKESLNEHTAIVNAIKGATLTWRALWRRSISMSRRFDGQMFADLGVEPVLNRECHATR
jgi:DNA-binding GntR family transcriptional regulator